MSRYVRDSRGTDELIAAVSLGCYRILFVGSFGGSLDYGTLP